MLKKKRFYKKTLVKVFTVINYLLTSTTKYVTNSKEFFFQNIFKISTSFKQLFFTFTNTSTQFCKLFSTGVLLKPQTSTFKFFKKSIFAINPLVMVVRYSFVSFFQKIYFIECLNYSKKQYLFLKKLLNSVNSQIRFIIFKKTYAYTTKPVKRIKRRVVKLLKNL